MKKVKNLVVDSGAFILNCPLQEYGEEIYTLSDVVNEIKDEKTIRLLQVLPYELRFREPTEEDVKYVANFAKKTGDFSRLSVTDIRLMALTVRLEKEYNNGQHLKEFPEVEILQTKNNSNQNNITVKDLEYFGYHVKKETNLDDDEDDGDQNVNENEKTDLSQIEIDDEDGWITIDNIEEIQEKMSKIELDNNRPDECDEINVACITGDYSMQNVLMQMGANVISPKDGLRIRHIRQYVLRCHACGRVNPASAKEFCKYCGNCRTLKRVATTINADGTVQLHINFKRPIKIRGTKYSLPAPRGGKHADNPILCEDQRIPQQRKSKMALQEKKLLTMQAILTDPDYLVRSNPFAVNDVYSRASRITHTSRIGNVNPNETRKPTGNKKKKKK